MDLSDYKRVFLLLFVFLSISFYKVDGVFAATLKATADIISTSRPSVSATLSQNVHSGDTFASVTGNGNSFLASDSARFLDNTNESLSVASVSALSTQVFFATPATQLHTSGSTIEYPVTSVHTVSFTTLTTIPVGGKIILTFPASNTTDTNVSSASASTFMFNNLSIANIQANFSSGTSTCLFTITGTTGGGSPTITCTVGSGQISPSTTVTLLIGCSVAGTSCASANQVPTLINPTKTAAAGTADVWTLSIQTTDASNGVLDSTKTKIVTLESVSLLAHIDPILTFTLSGVPDGISLASLCTNGGSNTDVTNSGFASTPSLVNLGSLTDSQVNISAQKMTVTSNSITGYTITATSSGHFSNTATGYFFQDAQGTPTGNNNPNPRTIGGTITPGSNRFGIHPCDLSSQSKVNTGLWGGGSGNNSFYANPSSAYYYTLVNSSTGPATNGNTFYVEYGASPQTTAPPGDYQTGLTYVVSTVF